MPIAYGQYLIIRRGRQVHLARASTWTILCGRPMGYEARVADEPWEQVPDRERCRQCEQIAAEERSSWARAA